MESLARACGAIPPGRLLNLQHTYLAGPCIDLGVMLLLRLAAGQCQQCFRTGNGRASKTFFVTNSNLADLLRAVLF